MPPDRFFDLAGQGSKDQMILCGIDSESWRSGGQGRRDHGAGLLGEQGFWGSRVSGRTGLLGEQGFWGAGLLGSRVLGTLCAHT